jgi:hypothetical protein
MLLTDLQGCVTSSGHIMLSDPVILCTDLRRFQPTNVAYMGENLRALRDGAILRTTRRTTIYLRPKATTASRLPIPSIPHTASTKYHPGKIGENIRGTRCWLCCESRNEGCKTGSPMHHDGFLPGLFTAKRPLSGVVLDAVRLRVRIVVCRNYYYYY